MFSRYIREVMEPNVLSAPPGTTVREAAAMMSERNVGAILVVVDGQLKGIFTERDALMRVVAKSRDPIETTLEEVMTKAPITVTPEQTFGEALMLMHEKGFRHVPVVKDNAIIGIISARNALDPDLEEFAAEGYRREHMSHPRK